MTQHLAKTSLSNAQRRLLEEMQQRSFGRVENLHIRRGEPVFDPAPRLIREVKFGSSDNGPRPERSLKDYLLKDQVGEMFRYFQVLGDGVIDVLEFKHGLPFRITVTEA